MATVTKMSVPSARIITTKERNIMFTKTPMDLPTLQKEYDQMVKIAMRSIDHGIELSPKFEKELMLMMRTIKAMGGNVR